MPANAKQRSIRLDVEIDDQLTEYARRTRRTINAAVNYLLSDALQAEAAERARGTPAQTGATT